MLFSMSAPLTGKTALVTDAASGTGKTIAKTLAAQGAQVAVQHPHAPEAAADVVKEIARAGGEAVALAADTTDPLEYEELVQALLDTYGHWDVLVNSAAEPAVVSNGAQLAEQHMADGGRIITAGADDQATRGLADTFEPRQITVNTVAPAESADPRELASVVAFLASDDAGWVTAKHILVTGAAEPE